MREYKEWLEWHQEESAKEMALLYPPPGTALQALVNHDDDDSDDETYILEESEGEESEGEGEESGGEESDEQDDKNHEDDTEESEEAQSDENERDHEAELFGAGADVTVDAIDRRRIGFEGGEFDSDGEVERGVFDGRHGEPDDDPRIRSDEEIPRERRKEPEAWETWEPLDDEANRPRDQPPRLGNDTDGDTYMAEPNYDHEFPTTPVALYSVKQRPPLKNVLLGLLPVSYNFPRFLQHVRDHPYFKTLPIAVDESSRINIWTTIRIQIPRSIFYPQQTCRLYAQPASGHQEARFDPLLYLPTRLRGVRAPEFEQLHDYSVGRMVLLFSLAPSRQVPHPRLMAYVQRFTAIPDMASGVSGFYGVAKAYNRGHPRYEVIAASQMARPCPLSPIFQGHANRDVTGRESLDYYDKFYINKFRNPLNFSFIHFT